VIVLSDVFTISLMLDFYGQLITEKQYEVLDLYYNNDLSLSEISEQIGITRQGVYDNIKNGKAVLEKLEEKLGLVKKHLERTEIITDILDCLDKLTVDDGNKEEMIERIKRDLGRVL